MADVFVFYDSNKRGNFTYDGTVGPWASLPTSQASAALKSLADFLAGSYATGIIVRGNTHHDYVQNSFDLWWQDAWSATSKLTFNFGARYTYPGVLGGSDGKLTNFLPDQGMVSTDSLYPAQKDAISPRVGVTFVPTESRKMVIRGGYGLFYDMLSVKCSVLSTRPSGCVPPTAAKPLIVMFGGPARSGSVTPVLKPSASGLAEGSAELNVCLK